MLQQRFQHGQAAVEFLLAAPVVLLLGLGSIEAIHWYFVRQAVSQALAQAARVAITQQADPAILDKAFSKALLPLYASPSPQLSRARLERAMARREAATGLPAWRIEIRSPDISSFADFASGNPDLPSSAFPTIDNDYLHEQHQARLKQGWPQGRGPLSGQTTIEANTLMLHLTWLHEPLLPGVKRLLRHLAPRDFRYGSIAMANAGYLPMHRQVAMLMQSHAAAWTLPAHGRVVRRNEPSPQPEGRPMEEWEGGRHTGSPGDTPSGVLVPPPPHFAPDMPAPTDEPPDKGSPPGGIENDDGSHAGPGPTGGAEANAGTDIGADDRRDAELNDDPDDCPGCCS